MESLVLRLLALAERVTLADLGLPVTVPHRERLSYGAVHHGEKFWIGIFYLPAGALLPLHNHPKMTVISRVMYGTVRIQSYDWIDADEYKRPQVEGSVRLAKLVSDETVTADSHCSLLHPEQGNIHSFYAVTECAILDVISPPYDRPDRPCSYYKERHSMDGGAPGPATPNAGDQANSDDSTPAGPGPRSNCAREGSSASTRAGLPAELSSAVYTRLRLESGGASGRPFEGDGIRTGPVVGSTVALQVCEELAPVIGKFTYVGKQPVTAGLTSGRISSFAPTLFPA